MNNSKNNYYFIGGICGSVFLINDYIPIKNCYNSADISIDQYNNATGGIVGDSYGIIKNCYNLGSIITEGAAGYNSDGTGGIVGSNHSEIIECYNNGNITAERNAGGISGTNFDNKNNVIDCYNTVTINGQECIGGITGRNGSTNNGTCQGATIKNCYNIGNIVENKKGSSIGNIVGWNKEKGILENCYYLTNGLEGYGINKSGENLTVYNKESEQMKNVNFVNQLKSDSYRFDENGLNNNYPILLWIKQIEIYEKPNKLVYKINADKLDLNGGKIKVKYNYSNYDVILDMDDERFKITGFDNTIGGTQEITVTLEEEFYASFNVMIQKLDSITITHAPSKTEYVEGQTFNTAGMEVTAHYNDETTAVVENYITSPTEPLTTSNNKITVSYEEGNITKTAEQTITVNPITLTSDVYTVEETRVGKIQPETTVEEFKRNIVTNADIVEIYNKSGQKLEENDTIGTGVVLKLNNIKNYTLIVLGDVDGDSRANFTDILLINKHRLNKVRLEEPYLTAADVTRDGKADFTDILKINKYRLGKISSL